MRPEVDVIVEDLRWSQAFNVDALVETVLDGAMAVVQSELDPAAEVSFLFCDDTRIAALNEEWRGKAAPTNVLSFPAQGPGGRSSQLLGDVVLAFDTISREAADEGKSMQDHTVHMIVHGFLHLLGYDHVEADEAENMEATESRILLALGLADPWSDDQAPTKASPL